MRFCFWPHPCSPRDVTEPDATIELTGSAAQNADQVVKQFRSLDFLVRLIRNPDLLKVEAFSVRPPPRIADDLREAIGTKIIESAEGRKVVAITINGFDQKGRSIIANALLHTFISKGELETAKQQLSILVQSDQALQKDVEERIKDIKGGRAAVDFDESTRQLIIHDVVAKLREIELAKIEFEYRLERAIVLGPGGRAEPLKEQLEILARQHKHLAREQISLTESPSAKTVLKQQFNSETLSAVQREQIQLQSRIRLAEIHVKQLIKSDSNTEFKVLSRPAAPVE